MPLLTSVFLVYFISNVESTSWDLLDWAGLFLVLIIAMGLAIIPTTFVSIALGYLGSWYTLPFMLLAYSASSLIGYYIGKKSDNTFWLDLINKKEKGQQIVERIQQKSPMIIFSCRLSPVLPFGITNVLFGMFNVKIKDFLIFGTLGMVPRTILSTWLGVEAVGLIEAFSSKDGSSIYQMATIGLVAISSLLLIRMFTKKISE